MVIKTNRFLVVLVSLFLLSLHVTWAQELNMATYNIRNFDYDRRADVRTNKQELASVLSQLKVDFIGVQEIVNDEEFKNFIQSRFPKFSTRISKCGGSGQQKLGVVFNQEKFNVLWDREDARLSNGQSCNNGLRPAMIVKLQEKISKREFLVITVHLKAGGQQRNADVRYRQYQILTEMLSELKNQGEKNIVIMGDFNTTDYTLRNQNYQRFIDFTDINSLIDFSAELSCTAYWWGGQDDGIERASVLDHVLMTSEFYNQFKKHEVSNQAHCKKVSCQDVSAATLGMTYQEVSDHCPVQVNLF